MKDYDVFGLVAGLFFIIGGVVLFFLSFKFWPTIFYSIFCLGIGNAILFSLKKQNEIEQIKSIKKIGELKKR